MTFSELRIGAAFIFADPVGFSIGRSFRKISARRYVQIPRAGVQPSNPMDTVYEVGTTSVKVERIEP